jgi:hypothetical protein
MDWEICNVVLLVVMYILTILKGYYSARPEYGS